MARKTSRRSVEVFLPPENLYELLLELEIPGQPSSKSNSRRIVVNRKSGQVRVIKSKKALSYTDNLIACIPEDAKLELGSLEEPLLLWVLVFYESNRPDLSTELIKDGLQKAGVIKNDRYIKVELSFGMIDQYNPRSIVRIYRLKEAE